MSEKESNMEEMNGGCPHCSGKHKDRDEKEKRDLMNRLKRIEGQVRGVEGMLENDVYLPARLTASIKFFWQII